MVNQWNVFFYVGNPCLGNFHISCGVIALFDHEAFCVIMYPTRYTSTRFIGLDDWWVGFAVRENIIIISSSSSSTWWQVGCTLKPQHAFQSGSPWRFVAILPAAYYITLLQTPRSFLHEIFRRWCCQHRCIFCGPRIYVMVGREIGPNNSICWRQHRCYYCFHGKEVFWIWRGCTFGELIFIFNMM